MKNKILAVLKNDTRLWQDEEFNQTLLIDLVEKYDKEVISILFEDEKLKQQFFVQVNNAWVFKVRDFVFFIEENKVNNSYTDYKNQIGLTDGKHFLKDTQDVVLDFPFKDCILEGGQSTDEGMDEFYQFDEKISVKDAKLGHKPNQYNLKQAKRKEIFFNQVLATDEIDRLLDPKALTNGKKYTKDGISNEVVFTRDENGLIKDNLIIKGNNLLALHSLKSNFAGKVKLIYIDPPYNTGGTSETFTYNNNFNHSTWMTFIKNRLIAAKEFLLETGFIVLTIDHYELFYVGVIMDEVLGRQNRIGIVTIVHKPEGRNQEKFFGTSNEFMLVYAKNKEIANFEKVVLDEKHKEKFDQQDEKGSFRYKNFIRLTDGKYALRESKPEFFYPIYVSNDLKKICLEKRLNYTEVYPITDKRIERTWKTKPNTFLKYLEAGNIEALEEAGKVCIYEKLREDQVIRTHWIKKEYHAYHFGTKLLEKTLGRKVFSFPKSIHAVSDTIKLMTKPNDIILDFFSGSATTGHAILEMNKSKKSTRQFILVEQLESHIEVSIERLKKVIDGSDQSGISKSINWQGGGDFIYCELAKWNETAKEKILTCKNLDKLIIFFDEMYEKYFLNYNLKILEFKEKVILEKNFKNLDLDKQKQMFLTMLDLNQMYVNKSEMADSKYQLSKENQNLTKDFYGNK